MNGLFSAKALDEWFSVHEQEHQESVQHILALQQWQLLPELIKNGSVVGEPYKNLSLDSFLAVGKCMICF
jgi:hypothetical protein